MRFMAQFAFAFVENRRHRNDRRPSLVVTCVPKVHRSYHFYSSRPGDRKNASTVERKIRSRSKTLEITFKKRIASESIMLAHPQVTTFAAMNYKVFVHSGGIPTPVCLQNHSIISSGFSTTFFNSLIHSPPTAPSTTLWSKLPVTMI